MQENQILKSLRMYPEDWKKFKKLKEQSGLPWPSFIKYVSNLAERDVKNDGN